MDAPIVASHTGPLARGPMKRIRAVVLVVCIAAAGTHGVRAAVADGEYRTIPSWNFPVLSITLGKEYEYTKSEGPDFTTDCFRNPDDTAVLTIYMGNHPQFSSDGLKAELIGKVKWYTRPTEYGFFSEALLPGFLASVEKGLLLHLAIHAKNREALVQFQRAVGTLKIVKVSRQPPAGAEGRPPAQP